MGRAHPLAPRAMLAPHLVTSSSNAAARFGGIHPALHTPFGPAPEQPVLHDELAALVERMAGAGVQGVVALGLAPEAATLTEDERAAVCRTVAGALAGGLPWSSSAPSSWPGSPPPTRSAR